jgi:hypothetical protein
MSIHEPSDGISEEVERAIQLALSAAALVARKLIEARRAAVAEAQARSDAEAAQMRAQLERERELARARVQAVHDNEWWEQAQIQDVASMSQTVEEWRDPSVNPDTTDFDHAHDRMDSEVSDRWGLSLEEVAALAAVDDLAAAHDQTQTANVDDTQQQAHSTTPSTRAYDTQQRRDQLRDRLDEARVPDDAAEARVLADTAQAQPVAEATSRDQLADRAPVRSRARTSSRERTRAR